MLTSVTEKCDKIGWTKYGIQKRVYKKRVYKKCDLR